MDDLPGLFARDFGVKPQGKAASMPPMAFVHVRKIFDDDDRGNGAVDGNDVFGGPKKYASFESHYENPFENLKPAMTTSIPLNDKPVFDEDIFNGIPGLKSSSASATATYGDVFSSTSTSSKTRQDNSSLDELLQNPGTTDTGGKKKAEGVQEDNLDFDDLITGFGPNSWLPTNRPVPESNESQQSSINTAAFSAMENPFAVPDLSSTTTVSSSPNSGLSADPLEEISKVSSSASRKANNFSVPVEVLDHPESLGSPEKWAPETSKVWNDTNHSQSKSTNDAQSSPMEKSESNRQDKDPLNDFMDSYRFQSVDRSASPLHVNPTSDEVDRPATESGIEENFDASSSGDVWLTVSEIPLFTQPTSAPPPSRPPPARPTQANRSKSSYNPFASEAVDEVSSSANSTQQCRSAMRGSERSSATPQINELDDFALGRTQNTVNGYPDDPSDEDIGKNSAAAAAAAMKEAMEKAEAKFRHAREMRGRENLKPARSREGCKMESDDPLEVGQKEKLKRLDRERHEKQREEEEKERSRQGKERRYQDEKEIEQIRFEKERVERERALARQAVERASREARERAAAQARANAEKAAVIKASAEARERAGRAAVQKMQAAVRERAAAEAKEKAAQAAAASREKENAEARAKGDRAAVERAASEARARAAAAAWERAAGLARASSTRNTVDGLSSTLGAAPSPSGLFQEVEGESEERRRARIECDRRTQERAAKALAEKNERDLQAQREQAERHRNAGTLDVEIKRWSAGKEGNIRALLSSLQYVLWPECGWQPVSLTDLITAASVKKAYRKATLCIHPDKVQQKGADIKQKYIAEKVFDMLKEAWNKLNSEELM